MARGTGTLAGPFLVAVDVLLCCPGMLALGFVLPEGLGVLAPVLASVGLLGLLLAQCVDDPDGRD